MTWLAIKTAFSRVPLAVWVALALLAAWGVDRTVQYRQGRAEGREQVLAELREAEAESLKKAATAARNADKAGEERALAEAEVRAADIAAIEEAEANDTNSLDALF